MCTTHSLIITYSCLFAYLTFLNIPSFKFLQSNHPNFLHFLNVLNAYCIRNLYFPVQMSITEILQFPLLNCLVLFECWSISTTSFKVCTQYNIRSRLNCEDKLNSADRWRKSSRWRPLATYRLLVTSSQTYHN